MLPNDKFKSYINLCLGLVLILMILKPLSDFLNTDISAEDLFPYAQQSAGNAGAGADSYSAIQEKLLQESLNNQAEAQMAGICANEGYKLVSVDVKVAADYLSLREIYITVKKINAESRPFIYIEPPASDEPPEIKRIKNTLSEVYNMSPDNIHISETV